MPRLRQNIITGEWVVVSPERAKRPDEYAKRPFSSELLHDKKCNFCIGGSAWETRIKSAGSNHIYVIPNKYPAYSPEDTLEETGHNFYVDNSSVGAHEILVMTNPHESLTAMSAERIFDLLTIMQKRSTFYEKDQSLESIVHIYNHGHEAGASVAHPHSQLFAGTITPARLAHEYFGAQQYHLKHNACVFCNIVKHELKENVRIIHKSSEAVAIAAYAPRFPFEMHIIPTHHAHAFANAKLTSIQSVAHSLHFALSTLTKKLHHPALNWYIHSARHIDHHLAASYHWHIEITPRLGTFGGYELASDTIIETVLPEVAAEFLRH